MVERKINELSGMRVLLTGITGNLGYEVSLDLLKRGMEVIPCVRPGKSESLSFHPTKFETVVECDLEKEEGGIKFSGEIDGIVHCAGIVNFRDAGDRNEQMARKVIRFAKKSRVPVYFVSTAFVYKPPDSGMDFHNSYEKDKFNAEQLLMSSDIPCAIFRPSVLTGHSRTGEIRNFSGYYLMVRAFLLAVRDAKAKNQILRFPRMFGKSDMIPCDQAAECMGKAIQENRLGTLYVTNPAPPSSEWLLNETLDFYGIRDSVNIVDMPFPEFGTLDLTEAEAKLYRFASHFNPYWSMEYAFPQSICTENLIDHDYVTRILTCFRDAESHG